MNWHVIVQVGGEDSYEPALASDIPRLVLSFDSGGETIGYPMRQSIVETLSSRAVRQPDQAAYDLAVLAMAVYAADHCIKRSTALDGWTREITVHIPVNNTGRWKKVCESLTRMLSFLSGDEWRIEFRKREHSPEFEVDDEQEFKPDAVSLFSGGIDSLVGAIDLLEQGRTVALVGHYGAGMTHHFQAEVFSLLQKHYGDNVKSTLFFVDPPTIADAERENTKRSRSLLFFSLGVLVANAVGRDIGLHVSENGLITLNVPLTDSRSGSLSTRTTHPCFASHLTTVLSHLGLQNPIHFPFKFKTKGEMIAESRNLQLLSKLLPHTMSCAHPEAARWHGLTPGTHCGYCVPCIIRKAAVQFAGAPDAEYAVDVLNDPPDRKSEAGRDPWAIRIAVHRFDENDRTHDTCDVLSSGPIEPDAIGEWVDVYRRGMHELSAFLASKKKTKK
jgi:7-cyano-7-deazaguanine synthase in queuosine biosynthesis